MNCPTCEVILLISDREGIEIHYCPKCRGIWLDRGELDEIIKRSISETTWTRHLDDVDRPRPERSGQRKPAETMIVRPVGLGPEEK